jgi:hypothetical protein
MFLQPQMVRRRLALLAVVTTLGLAATARAEDFQCFPDDATHSSDAIFAAIAKVPDDAGIVYDADGSTDTIQVWNFDALVYVGPVDVTATLDRIRLGYWMSDHPNDGGFFTPRGNQLPNVPRLGDNYYIEFVVWPDIDLDAATYDPTTHPFDDSVNFPGPMRILLGMCGEVYFSGDHYSEGPAHLPAYYVNPTGP